MSQRRAPRSGSGTERGGTERERLRALLERVGEACKGILSPQTEVPQHDKYLLSMFQRCRSLYMGVLILLDNELTDEALMLGRALFSESLRLQQVAESPEDRAGLLLNWVEASLEKARGLYSKTEKITKRKRTADVVAAIDREIEQLRAYAKRIGVKKQLSFQTEHNAYVRLGRVEDYWTFLYSHNSVHGEELALRTRRRALGQDVTFLAVTDDLGVIRTTGAFAARSLLAATRAVATVYGAPGPVISDADEAALLDAVAL